MSFSLSEPWVHDSSAWSIDRDQIIPQGKSCFPLELMVFPDMHSLCYTKNKNKKKPDSWHNNDCLSVIFLNKEWEKTITDYYE